MAEFPEAEVYVDDDGDLCFDWYGEGRGRVVSVAINQSGNMVYAWLCDGEHGHGVVCPHGEIPVEILTALHRVHGGVA